MSQITSHVLDTALGKPAAGITISLDVQMQDESWICIGRDTTNSDGRVIDLVPYDHILSPGIYRLLFDIKSYFDLTDTRSFYPIIPIIFEVTDGSHYHVPLLLNPYGYSTYRGS